MFTDEAVVLECLETSLAGKKVLVVGDLMLDRYIWGAVQRISPEAPVPVIKQEKITNRPGGAGNVAMNLAGLGLQVQLAGWLGQDADGQLLKSLLEDKKIGTGSIQAFQDRPTTTKTRVVGGHQQMLRIDREVSLPLSQEEEQRFLNILQQALSDKPEVVVLSDYAKGALTDAVCQGLIHACKEKQIPVLVDPKGKSFSRYTGATAITPNKSEMALASGVPATDPGFSKVGDDMRASLDLEFLIVTLGEDGIRLHAGEEPATFPAMAREVFDVSGAGDTVVALLAAGFAGGLPLEDSIKLANLAAGIVVGKVGTVPVQQDEMLSAIHASRFQGERGKVMQVDELQRRILRWKKAGETVVFTNGCFDLLHAGHVSYLESASLEGDHLVIGLNTDASVRRLKGPERPVIGEQDRARVLAALGSVDAVVLFEEDTPLNLISTLRPDVLVKGSDYQEHEVVGATEVKSWGGRVVLIDVLSGRSSSRIMEQIRN